LVAIFLLQDDGSVKAKKRMIFVLQKKRGLVVASTMLRTQGKSRLCAMKS
jgi:hypothetical protein